MKSRHLIVYILLIFCVFQIKIINGGVLRKKPPGPNSTSNGVACNNVSGPKACSNFKPNQNNINIYVGDGTGGGNVISNIISIDNQTISIGNQIPATEEYDDDETDNLINPDNPLQSGQEHVFEVIQTSPIGVSVSYANLPPPVISPDPVVENEVSSEENVQTNLPNSDEDMVIVINEQEVGATIEEIIQENVVDKPAEDEESSVIVEIMEAPQSEVVTVVIDESPQPELKPEVVQAIEDAVQNNSVENSDLSDVMLEVVDTLHPVIIEAFTVQDTQLEEEQVVLEATDNDLPNNVDYDFDDTPVPIADETNVQMEVTQGYIIHTPDHHDYLLLDTDDNSINIQPLAEVVIDSMEHSGVVVLEIDPIENHETQLDPIDTAVPLAPATIGHLPIPIPTFEELQNGEIPKPTSALNPPTSTSHLSTPSVGSGGIGISSGNDLLSGLGSNKPQLGSGHLSSAIHGLTQDQPLGGNLGWGSGEPGSFSPGLVMDAVQNIGGNAAILTSHTESLTLVGNSTVPAMANVYSDSSANFTVYADIIQESTGIEEGMQITDGGVDGSSTQMSNVATLGQENQLITEGASESVGEGTVVQMAQGESAHHEDELNQHLSANSEPEPNVEPQLKPESNMEPELEPNMQLELEPEPNVEAEFAPEPIVEPELKPEPNVELELIEPAPNVEPEFKPEPIVESELIEPQPNVEPEVKPEPIVELELEANVEPELAPEPIVEPELIELEPNVKPELAPEPNVEPEHAPEPNVEPEVEPESIVEPELAPEPNVEPELAPEPIVELELIELEPNVEPELASESNVETELEAEPLPILPETDFVQELGDINATDLE